MVIKENSRDTLAQSVRHKTINSLQKGLKATLTRKLSPKEEALPLIEIVDEKKFPVRRSNLRRASVAYDSAKRFQETNEATVAALEKRKREKPWEFD